MYNRTLDSISVTGGYGGYDEYYVSWSVDQR